MRIVSLLPSATEILFALGLGDEIVGVSHECDYPPEARTKRIVIRSRISQGLSAGEIDVRVREHVSRGESLYSVDAAALEELAPDLILTQDLCHVCAASPDDLASALAHMPRQPRVLSLNPQGLAEVWTGIQRVGEATGREESARALLVLLEDRLACLDAQVSATENRPRVAYIEWLDPLFAGGHWVPEMIARAGGEDVLGRARTPSFRVTPEQVMAAAPQILLIAPCGYEARKARVEYFRTQFPTSWAEIPAVRHRRVYALEAAGYYSRPGPRLIHGLESLAKLFHPAIEVTPEAPGAILPVTEQAKIARPAPD